MNIIILIIANDDNESYIEMQQIWRKYMNNHSNIKSYFIKNKIDINEDIIVNQEENTIYVKNNENLIPGILQKTIKSFEYCLQNFEFDYIYRTNLSSFIDLNKAYHFLENNKFDYGGCGIYKCIMNHTLFASGCGFIISKNCTQELINNKNLINYKIIDDVAIGEVLIYKLNYNIFNISRYDVQNINDIIFNNDTHIFHFRCKSDDKHINTISYLNKMFTKIYTL